MAVTRDIHHAVRLNKQSTDFRQYLILHGFVAKLIGTFKLNTNGELIAAFPPPPARYAGMPGSAIKRYELVDTALAVNHEMTTDLHPVEVRQARGNSIELATKQLPDEVATKFPGRQTDAVHHNQAELSRYPLILVRALPLSRSREEMFMNVQGQVTWLAKAASTSVYHPSRMQALVQGATA